MSMTSSMSLVISPAVAAAGCLNEQPKWQALNCNKLASKRKVHNGSYYSVCTVNWKKGRYVVRKNYSRGGRFSCKSQLTADLAPPAATAAAYGLLLLGGGVFAYSKSGSKGSLFGGLTGAALMATTYILLQAPETKAIGDALGFGSAFLFSSVFGIRLAATRKLTPAGPLLFLSVGALGVFISAYLQDSL